MFGGTDVSYVGLDHELLDALHEIIDFWYNQLPRHHSLEQGKGRHAAARGLHVPKRPFQQRAQLLRARLPGAQTAQFSEWLINLEICLHLLPHVCATCTTTFQQSNQQHSRQTTGMRAWRFPCCATSNST